MFKNLTVGPHCQSHLSPPSPSLWRHGTGAMPSCRRRATCLPGGQEDPTVAHLLRTSLTSLSSPKFWIESHLRPPSRTARYRRRRRRLATLWMSPGPADAVNHSAASLSPSPPEESSWGGPQPRPRPRPPCLGRAAPRTIPAIPDHSSSRSPSPDRKSTRLNSSHPV